MPFIHLCFDILTSGSAGLRSPSCRASRTHSRRRHRSCGYSCRHSSWWYRRHSVDMAWCHQLKCRKMRRECDLNVHSLVSPTSDTDNLSHSSYFFQTPLRLNGFLAVMWLCSCRPEAVFQSACLNMHFQLVEWYKISISYYQSNMSQILILPSALSFNNCISER